LHLVDALFAQTQTRFGISFINRNVSIKLILLTWFITFSFSCLQTKESSQRVVHLARYATHDSYNIDTFAMNKSQSCVAWWFTTYNVEFVAAVVEST